MTRKKSVINLARTLFIISVMLMLITAWAPGVAESKTAIRFAHHHPVKAYPHQWAVDFKTMVEKDTKGAVEVQVFPAGQLGKERENVNGCNMGTIDMTFSGPPFLDHWYPAAGMTMLPFLIDNHEHAERAFGMDGKAGKLITEEVLKKSNIRTLGYVFAGFRCMYFRSKVVTKIEDFKGLKMRSPEHEIWLNMFRYLGAKPTPISWGEVYTAVQTGVVDGMDGSILGSYQNRFYEVAKQMSLTNHMLSIMSPYINKNFYAKLKPEFQKIVSDSAAKASRNFNQKSVKLNQWAKGEMIKEGVKIHNIDREPMIKAVLPMIDEFIKKTNARPLYEQIIGYRKK